MLFQGRAIKDLLIFGFGGFGCQSHKILYFILESINLNPYFL
jgi:hypothetical protein